MHSDHDLRCNAAICRWQWGSIGLNGADGVCMCSVCAVILLHSCWLFHHSLSLVVPWPEAPFSPPSTLSHTGSVTLRCFLAGSPNALQFSLCSLPSHSFALLRNNDLWIVIFIIKQCSCMLAATWFIPRFCWDHTADACQYVWEKKRWSFGLKKTQRDPRNAVSKVQYVHFYPSLWIWLWWKKSNNDKTIALG